MEWNELDGRKGFEKVLMKNSGDYNKTKDVLGKSSKEEKTILPQEKRKTELIPCSVPRGFNSNLFRPKPENRTMARSLANLTRCHRDSSWLNVFNQRCHPAARTNWYPPPFLS